MYWEPIIEAMPSDELQTLQLHKLQHVTARAACAPSYIEKFREVGVSPDQIRSIDDLRRVPFTTKEDLRAGYPYGFLCVPKEDIIRVHSSSGTTGAATAVLYAQSDIDAWSNLIARCMYMTNVRRSDVFQNVIGYGLFTGGLGFHYGAEKLGVLVIPSSTGNTRRQISLMREFGTTAIHVIPSYALRLYSAFEEMGLDPKENTELKVAFIGAEPHSEMMRQRIEALFGIHAFNSYGLSEMNGPGVAFECYLKDGMHVWEDAYILEIIDPVTLEPVPDGEEGELVFTTLCREGMPLLRYRSRDLAAIIPEPCPCGRTHRRITRIKGRSDDMLIIKGVNIFPMQIERTLMNIAEVGNNYQIILETANYLDKMTVLVEVTSAFVVDDPRPLDALRRRITSALRDEILVEPEVHLVEPGSIPRTEGKAVRVIDKRET